MFAMESDFLGCCRAVLRCSWFDPCHLPYLFHGYFRSTHGNTAVLLSQFSVYAHRAKFLDIALVYALEFVKRWRAQVVSKRRSYAR